MDQSSKTATPSWVQDGAIELYKKETMYIEKLVGVYVLLTLLGIYVTFLLATRTDTPSKSDASFFFLGFCGFLIFLDILIDRRMRKNISGSKKWKTRYLKKVIAENKELWKKKDDLLHTIKMEAVEKEEVVWNNLRTNETITNQAELLLLELEPV